MKTFRLSDLDPAALGPLVERGGVSDRTSVDAVRGIVADVRERGDAAIRELTLRFDGADLAGIRVAPEAFADARAAASPELADAIRTAAANIRAFHSAQLAVEPAVETMPGVLCWRERRAIESVGLYVPAGSAPLPSTVLMLGIPAILAGCSRIVLCSPPRRDGTVDPAVLVAAGTLGIDEVYAVGGAQAVAAMAYGTESVPKVEKIFGPGNRYVAAAKELVSADPRGAAIDLLAGPSELLVLADASADAALVAADLLSQAEHDPDAHVVLVTDSPELAAATLRELDAQLGTLSRRAIVSQALEGSYAIVADSMSEAVRFSNMYGPEHLIVNVREPEPILRAITSAGSVFVGPWAPVTAGDYASGTNHTLPTSGAARWESGLSVESFQKSISFQRITASGLEALAPTLTALAGAEGLDAHARAVTRRIDRLREGGLS
ncbi:MAG: histidinol dehydrogenase [Bacteroidetes bacterium]|nr:histidinol dehydrogenase [Bacteroidota bacterium]